MKVGLVGFNGFVGKALVRSCDKRKDKIELVKISRESYESDKKQKYDVLINTAMPSRRFWALNNPKADFDASVGLTADLLYEWQWDKFVQISSQSARTQLDVPYGVHKRAAEVIVENKANTLIVRLAALYGNGNYKGALYDLIHRNRVYVDINSEYNFLDIDFAAEWIINNLDKTGIKEVSAMDTISLAEIAKEVWPEVEYEGRKEVVFSDLIEPGMPSAKEVWTYVRQEVKKAQAQQKA